MIVLVFRFRDGLRSGGVLRVILYVPRRYLFIQYPARYAQQRRDDKNYSGDLEVVRPEIRAADSRRHYRGGAGDRVDYHELYQIHIRKSREIGHGILRRAGDEIENEHKAVALLAVLQKTHALQLVFKTEDAQDARADPPGQEQDYYRADDITQPAQHEAAEPAPYKTGADLDRLGRDELDDRLQDADRDEYDDAPDAEPVDPRLEAVGVLDQLDSGLAEVQVHKHARADDGKHSDDNKDALDPYFFL